MVNFENQNQLPEQKKSKTLDNLPNDVLHHIFNLLPIKNAIVASTVSHMYKTSWCYNRRFLFCCKDLDHGFDQHDLVAIVDHVFQSHKGNKIKTFKLHIDPIGIEALLMRWLKICTHKDLEDLELHFYKPGFTVEFSVLNELKKLKTLELVNCKIQLSQDLSGLQFLQTLYLMDLNLTEEMFEEMIKHFNMLAAIYLINCSTIKKLNIIARGNRHLKKLRIVSCNDLKEIQINSPTLGSFFYKGIFLIVRIAQDMQLYEAFFYFTPSKNYMKTTQLEALVKDFSHVSILTTTPQLIEGMGARIRDGVFREAQYCFVNLRELQLFMDGGTFCNPYDIAMFLKNCPSLAILFVDLSNYQFDLGMYWQMHHKPQLDNCNHKFTQLKVVVLKSFKFLPSELELVKIILQRSTILERLILIPPFNKSHSKFKKQDAPQYDKLIRSWSASSSINVVVCEKHDQNIVFNPTHPKYWISWK